MILIASGWTPPAGHQNWWLEVGPGLAGLAAIAFAFPRFPMSRLIYGAAFFHMLILNYGGIYSYAHTPLGDWAKDAFHLARNHYDRLGHLALGFVPAIAIREVLLRRTPLKQGGWLTFLVIAVAFAIGAFWELIEWWTTLIVAGDVGTAFLGTQGDPWDAQWDMFLVGVGAAISMATMTRWHDASLRRLVYDAKSQGTTT